MFHLKPWFYQWKYHGCPDYVDKSFLAFGGWNDVWNLHWTGQSEGSWLTFDQWDSKPAMLQGVTMCAGLNCLVIDQRSSAVLLSRAEWSHWGTEELRHASLWNCDLRNSGRGTPSPPIIGQYPALRFLIGWWRKCLSSPRGGGRCLNVMIRQYSTVFRDSTQ